MNNPPPTLRLSQREAIKAFDKVFYDKKVDRGILSACCGFGKTFLCYKLIEHCISKGELIFIIATSRAKLVNQSLSEKNKYIPNIKLNLIGICSDYEKENTKHIKANSEDIRNSVENNYAKNTPSLIITTYNSAKKIKEALSNSEDDKLLPNLIIFDEAHNTAGDTQKYHRELIDDEEFCIDKYLFMTATPLKLIKKNEGSNYRSDETVFSMDNEDIYGKIFYEFTFKEGIEQNIICDFDVITFQQKDEISDNTKELINSMNREEKQIYYYKTVSKFALDSINKYDLKHLLVYLPNKNKVTLFKKELEKLITEDNKKIDIFKILSEDKKSSRIESEQKFRQNGDPKILLSVGIFNEGIDIPVIDAVLFAEERSSETTIVQNIGRCLRTLKDNPNKRAYVLLPNILYEYQTDNDSLKNYSSRFKSIRHVIDVMKEGLPNNYYKKYVRLEKNMFNDLDEEHGIETPEKIIEENVDITFPKSNVDIENIQLVNNYYDIKKANGKLSSTDFFKLIKLLKNNDITTLDKYKSFAEKHDIIELYPHNEFLKDFKSYAHFFSMETFNYEEAKKFIATKIDIKYRDPENWSKFLSDVYKSKINNSNEYSHIDDDIIKLPIKPKQYYLDKWDDGGKWDGYLSIGKMDPNPIIVATINSDTSSTNANQNIKNIINNDSTKVNILVGTWNPFNGFDQNNLSQIKKYIDAKFGIDCTLTPRIKTKRGRKDYENVIIWCQRANDIGTKRIPIVVYPKKETIQYDSDIVTDKINKKITCDKDKEEYLPPNPLITTELNDIISNAKKYILDNKN